MIIEKIFFRNNSFTPINFVFSFFPISFILGNFASNLNLIIFCILGLFHLRGKISQIKFNLSIKIIFLFFLIILFSTSLSFLTFLYYKGYEYDNFFRLIKSLLFFRFFLMLIIVYFLSEFEILDFKYLFVCASICAFLVSLDVIFQYAFGYNVLGFKSAGHHNSSFFNEEWISGGFIQNFSFFSILFVALILKNKSFYRFLLTIVVICILAAGILFSGNRMPLILFIFGLFILLIINRELLKIIVAGFVSLFLIFCLAGILDERISTGYISFYQNTENIVSKMLDKNKENETETKIQTSKKLLVDDFDSFWLSEPRTNERSGYIKLFNTAIDTWKQNKIYGNGIKSFRVDCIKFQTHKKNRMCSNHPHNYYLEILTETGILGFLIVSIIAIYFIIFIFNNFKFLKGNSLENYILLAATISLILETFPIKSTGSIFSTNNTTYLILISSIILSYKKILDKNKFS